MNTRCSTEGQKNRPRPSRSRTGSTAEPDDQRVEHQVVDLREVAGKRDSSASRSAAPRPAVGDRPRPAAPSGLAQEHVERQHRDHRPVAELRPRTSRRDRRGEPEQRQRREHAERTRTAPAGTGQPTFPLDSCRPPSRPHTRTQNSGRSPRPAASLADPAVKTRGPRRRGWGQSPVEKSGRSGKRPGC